GAPRARQGGVPTPAAGPLRGGAPAPAGPGSPLAPNGCAGAALAPGAGCPVTVAFKPAAAGAATGTLAIAGDGGALSVALTGTGVAAPTGAALPPNVKTTFVADTTGSSSSVTVPLHCPDATICLLDGTVVISTDDLLRGHASAAALQTKTVARFAGVRVAPGKVKKIKLHLSPSFVKTAQKRGVRYIHAVLTVNTTF